MSDEFYAADAAEQIRRWDAGASVWSIELGGLGPSYEQAIQVLAIELTRDHLKTELPRTDDVQAVTDWGNPTVHRINEWCGGFSGAQVAASKWLAWKWLTIGPSGLIARAKSEGKGKDLIQVSNFWPRVPMVAT